MCLTQAPGCAALLRQVGVGSFPSIRIVDANHKGRRGLLLTHEHDGRDLERPPPTRRSATSACSTAPTRTS